MSKGDGSFTRWSWVAALTVIVGFSLSACGSKDPTPTAVSSVPSFDTTVTTTTAVEVAASRLRWPPLKVGDTSDRVKVLQYLLSANQVAVSADGKFGPKTKVAMNAFQTRKTLVVSETMTDETWLALATTVTETSSPDQIRALQVALTIPGYPAKVTGVYDQTLTDLIATSRADSGSPSLGQPTVNDWLTLVGIGD
jgi:peptidoglycan hydrolase-like protein with peptidoglycan-binding domain